MDIRPLGDQAVRVEFGQEISPEVHRRVRRFCRALAEGRPDGVTEWVPAYATVAVYYQPHRVRYGELCAQLAALAERGTEDDLTARMGHGDPCVLRRRGRAGPGVCCGLPRADAGGGRRPARAADVSDLPARLPAGLPVPGRAAAGTGDAAPGDAAVPVPAGSVGIAGAQTGVYPFATPGGWQIIGRTSLVLYDAERQPPALLRAGDYVQFVPVTEEEAAEIARQVGQGEYEPRRYVSTD